jgi:transcriptional regulator with XRE-family HTH domain
MEEYTMAEGGFYWGDQPPEMQHLGEEVHRERRRRKWSQKELAQRVDMSPSTLSNLETGKLRTITIVHLLALARTFGRSIDSLLGEEEESQVRRKSPDRKPAAKRNVKTGIPKRTRTPEKALKG